MMYLFYPNPVTPGFLPAEAKLSEIPSRKTVVRVFTDY